VFVASNRRENNPQFGSNHCGHVLVRYLTLTINNWIFFYNCHRADGLFRLFQNIKDETETMKTKNINSQPAKEKRNQIIIFLVSTILVAGNTGIKLWDMTHRYLIR